MPEIQIASTPADDTVLQLSAPGVTAIVRWDDVVRAAAPVSARDFEDLILADSEGKTLWQRERTTPRIGNLKTLLSVEPEPSGWFTTSWQRHRTTVKKEQDAIQPIPVLAPTDFGGVSSYVFVQSVTPVAKGIGNKAPLYLAGIVSRRSVERQAMHIPVVGILLCVLPVALLFLALPFIKLATLTPKERYSFVDVAMLGVAAVAAAGLGAAMPFGPAVIDSSVDATLGKLADEIERRFAHETSTVLDLASALQAHHAKLSGPAVCHGTRARDTRQSMASPPQREKASSTIGCDLWHALDALQRAEADDASLAKVTLGAVELDVVAWLDRRGEQVRKWTTKSVATALVPHASYTHFRDLVAGKTWTLTDRSLNQMPFTLEPLRTPTTAQMGFVFAVRTSDVEQPYFVLNVRPHSVVDPLMPPGFGFAVMSDDGSVLFHSEEGLSLAEGFLDEVNDRDVVRAAAASGHTVTWSGDYHGRPHRLHLQAMPRFANSRWRIVTFQESGPVFNPQLAILRMMVVNFAVLMLIAVGFWLHAVATSRRLRDLLLVPLSATTSGVWLLVALVVISARLVGWTFYPSANRHLNELYLWFLVIPLLAVAVALVSRRWLPDKFYTQPGMAQRRSHAPRRGHRRRAWRRLRAPCLPHAGHEGNGALAGVRAPQLGGAPPPSPRSRERPCQQSEDQRAAADDRSDPHLDAGRPR